MPPPVRVARAGSSSSCVFVCRRLPRSTLFPCTTLFRSPAGARARLLLADGDRLFAAGRAPAAAARYARIVDLVPDSLEAQLARVRELRVRAAQADSMGDLAAVRARLGGIAQGPAAGDARALDELLGHVLATPDVDEGVQFRTAELIRDSLGAAHLAAR